MGQVQVGDEGAHQPRLADAGGQREAQRRELALEVLQRREFGLQCRQHGRDIPLVGEHVRRGLDGACQPFEGLGLRRAEREAATDRVEDASVHRSA